jgi:hypothetical protein
MVENQIPRVEKNFPGYRVDYLSAGYSLNAATRALEGVVLTIGNPQTLKKLNLIFTVEEAHGIVRGLNVVFRHLEARNNTN